MGATLNYYAVRDEYTVVVDKVKALEQTYNCLNEQFKSRVAGKNKSAALGTMSAATNTNGQNHYLESGMLPGLQKRWTERLMGRDTTNPSDSLWRPVKIWPVLKAPF